MQPKKRTKAQYARLYDQPTLLFPGGPDDAGVQTILFPNGESELWFKTADGLGFSVTVGNGPHGLGLRVRRFVGTPPLTVAADETEVELCQYRDTPKAHAFRRWYQHEATDDDIALLGESYRREGSK